MAKASVAHIKIVGGYCEIRNPARRAIPKEKTDKRCVRTVNLIRKNFCMKQANPERQNPNPARKNPAKPSMLK